MEKRRFTKEEENKIIDLYVKQKKSKNNIGKLFNCSNVPIGRVLRENKIKTIIGKGLDKKKVIELYEKGKSAREMGRIFNCSRIPLLSILKKEGIYVDKRRRTKGNYRGTIKEETKRKIRNALIGKKRAKETIMKIAEKKRKKLDLEKIRRMYIIEEKSCQEIGKESNVCTSVVYNRLKELNVKLRRKASEKTKRRIRKARAKQIFPIKDTKIEIKIQNFLKKLGIEFFTHQYIKKIKHSYQCDILIPSMNLVIECDGDYWHKYPIGKEIDHIRTKELIEKGFKVLRLWEFEIKAMDINEFKEKLKNG